MSEVAEMSEAGPTLGSIPWAVLDVEHNQFKCERCLQTEQPPTMPIDLDQFVDVLNGFARRHEDCMMTEELVRRSQALRKDLEARNPLLDDTYEEVFEKLAWVDGELKRRRDRGAR